MARIRTIKPDFWTDETLTECSLTARLLFIGMWNFADDHGGIDGSVKQLKMKIFPADNVDVAPLVSELITHGLLIEYLVHNKKYLHIKGFTKHQVINRPSKPQYPMFDESLRFQETPTEDSLDTHGVLTEDSLREGKGRERKGKEKESSYPLEIATEQKAKMTINDFRFIHQDKFGISMPPGCNQLAHELCQQFTIDSIITAFETAAIQGKQSVAYVKGVLMGSGPKQKEFVPKSTWGMEDGNGQAPV